MDIHSLESNARVDPSVTFETAHYKVAGGAPASPVKRTPRNAWNVDERLFHI